MARAAGMDMETTRMLTQHADEIERGEQNRHDHETMQKLNKLAKQLRSLKRFKAQTASLTGGLHADIAEGLEQARAAIATTEAAAIALRATSYCISQIAEQQGTIKEKIEQI